jgi:hypothetical protein
MNMLKSFRLLFIFLPAGMVTLWNSCASPPDYPIEPLIEYVGMTKDTLRRPPIPGSGGKIDTIFVTFSFTDGDGDIGNKDSLDLFLTDTRTGVIENQYRIPLVPDLGASNGIKGEITFRLFSTCCIFPPELGLDPCFGEAPSFRYDKVIYDIYLIDRAGHKSNVIQTEPIYVRCFK